MGLPLRKADKHYTYGDYRHWPEEERWELIEGVAWNMSEGASPSRSQSDRPGPAPNRYHQGLSTQLSAIIWDYLEDKSCKVYHAPFDVLLPAFGEEEEDDVSTVVQPDLSVICDTSKLTPKGCTGAPDWIIEIISPYTSKKDMTVKFYLYQRHGVKEYWIVEPAAQYIHVYLLDSEGKYPADPDVYEIYGEHTVVPCTVLKGLSIDLRELFGNQR